MVIVPDDSWSASSLSSVRTAPNSVATIRTPRKLLVWSWSSKRPPPKRASIVPHKRSLTREGFGHVVVVDQSRFANSGGDHGEGARLLESSRIHELGVLQMDERFERQAGRDPSPQAHRVALSGRIRRRRLAKGGADAPCRLALFGAEVHVPRAER